MHWFDELKQKTTTFFVAYSVKTKTYEPKPAESNN